MRWLGCLGSTLVVVGLVGCSALVDLSGLEGHPAAQGSDSGGAAPPDASVSTPAPSDGATATDDASVPVEPVDAAGACVPACAPGSVCDGTACILTSCSTAAGELPVILRPTGSPQGLVSNGLVPFPLGTFLSQAVDDTGDGDGDGSYIASAFATTGTLRLTKSQLLMPAGYKQVRLIVHARARRTQANPPGMSGIQIGLHFPDRAGLDPNWNSGSKATLTTYTHETIEFPLYPWDMTPWTIERVNTVELLVLFVPLSTTNAVRVSQVWLEACFAP